MQSLVKRIIDEKLSCFFISPHLDDAILSAGGLITALAGKTNVTVVTVFTKITPPPYTLSIRQFLKQCGFVRPDHFYSERRKEDIRLMNKLKVSWSHLGYVEAMWRKHENPSVLSKFVGRFVPEALYIYPVYRWHITAGRVSLHDKMLMKQLRIDLHRMVKKDQKAIVFCPVGVGKNVDHIFVRDVCTNAFPSNNLIYWSDAPYNLRAKPDHKFLMQHKLVDHFYETNMELKSELIRGYETQWRALFPSLTVPVMHEKYFTQS